EMQAGPRVRRHRLGHRTDPVDDCLIAIAQRVRALAHAGVAKWRERRVVETFRPGDVAHADRDMIEHLSNLLVMTTITHRSGVPGTPPPAPRLRHCPVSAQPASGRNSA